jgi:hypothetical protein
MLRPDPAQRGRLEEIRGNLLDRIAEAEREAWVGEAEREAWVGEAEGLRISLAGVRDKLSQIATPAPSTSAYPPSTRSRAGTTSRPDKQRTPSASVSTQPASSENIRAVSRERRLAHLRRHQPQPAARRGLPGWPRLRQSTRRHAAPRPHRRRCPHRPPRPGRDHPAPARELAPPAGLAEPLRSRLRPGRPGGLTSPHPSPCIPRPQWPPGIPPAKIPDQDRGQAAEKSERQ